MVESWQLTQVRNIPNGLSLSRVALGATMPLWWYLGTEALIIVVLWAGVSDGLDGWWARRFGGRTPLGVVIDPLADKAFTIPFLFMSAVWYQEPLIWSLFLVNLGYDIDNTWQRRREINDALAGRYASAVRPVTWLSKTKTALLFGFMVAVAAADWYPQIPIDLLAIVSLTLVSVSWFQNRKHLLSSRFRG